MYRGFIHVMPKEGILDPQGKAVEGALARLGHADVSSVRAGKYFEVTLAVRDRGEAERLLHEISRKVLSNPVIESYRCDLSEVDPS